MKIGIDCRLAGPTHAGIGRYSAELVSRLIANKTHNWVLFFYDQTQAEMVLPQSAFEHKHVSITYAPIRHYTITEQLKLPGIFAAQKLDLLHVPHFNVPIFYSGCMVVTIHDLLWHDHRGTMVTTLPVWQYWIKYFFYRFVTRQAAKKATAIIVPAKTIQRTLARYYPNASHKVSVITEGYSEVLVKAAAKLGKVARNKKQLLYVGSLYPHKNIQLVLRALQKLPNYTLQIVGARSVFLGQTESLAQKLGVAQQVSFLGYVPDKRLAKLYKQSAALVQPSFSEGFGLTGIEALALETPVLASTIPTFKEIYQNAALYFDPTDVDSFVAATQSLSELSHHSFAKTAKQVVSQYSWNDMAAETLAVYQKITH